MQGALQDRRKELEEEYKNWKDSTISERFVSCAEKYPNNTFIIDNGKSITYQYAQEETAVRADWLAAYGVGRGSHVAVLLDNCAEFVYLTFAVSALRAVKIALHTRLHMNELKHVLGSMDANFLITTKAIRKRVFSEGEGTAFDGAPDEEPLLEIWKVLCYEDEMKFRREGAFSCTSRQDRKTVPALKQYQAGDPGAVSDIFYTSGSSSLPKGVMLTHTMLLRSAYANCLNRGFEPGRRIFIPLPLYHVYAYVEGLLAVLYVGGTLILQRKFNISEAVELMQQHQANDILAVPSIMIKLLNDPEALACQWPDLHSAYCSASLCPEWVWGEIRERLGIDDVITGYGMTEVSGASMQTSPEDDPEILKHRLGRILAGGSCGAEEFGGNILEYKVIDPETGVTLGPLEEGELCCRGLTVTEGYYNNPEANREARDSEGWLKTGDIGAFDKQGYFEFRGRRKDSYKFNGENVSTHYVENVLNKIDGVKNAALVGIEDVRYGEVGVAFIEFEEGKEKSEEELRECCGRMLGRFQIPSHFMKIQSEDWPLGESGKIQKKKLKEKARWEATRRERERIAGKQR